MDADADYKPEALIIVLSSHERSFTLDADAVVIVPSAGSSIENQGDARPGGNDMEFLYPCKISLALDRDLYGRFILRFRGVMNAVTFRCILCEAAYESMGINHLM
ncbi:hypothetical protein MRB53_041802 [Persea americana]|nr:hypothetical protein MRB53_041802 [Persea americana]